MSDIFVVDTDADGRATRYSCEQLMEYNEAYPLSVDYYYDIMHASGKNTTEVVADGKEALLKSVAENFGLIDGARCSIPPVTALWLIEVDSGSVDEPQNIFSKFGGKSMFCGNTDVSFSQTIVTVKIKPLAWSCNLVWIKHVQSTRDQCPRFIWELETQTLFRVTYNKTSIILDQTVVSKFLIWGQFWI
jgi:hypothetical protein